MSEKNKKHAVDKIEWTKANIMYAAGRSLTVSAYMAIPVVVCIIIGYSVTTVGRAAILIFILWLLNKVVPDKVSHEMRYKAKVIDDEDDDEVGKRFGSIAIGKKDK